MNDDLTARTARELIMQLAMIEASIRTTATFSRTEGDEQSRPVNHDLIGLAGQEQRIIAELRRRDNVIVPHSPWASIGG